MEKEVGANFPKLALTEEKARIPDRKKGSKDAVIFAGLRLFARKLQSPVGNSCLIN